ncbi:hypothetical protein [Streptomyces sp. NPDC020597]|uniref:hypothetical protein n=1 Tax=unclassified Streptomyces TaxID=2593676 RepID=UPI00378B9E57
MTFETPEYDDSAPFEVSRSPESALPRPENEGVNVCRVSAISMMFSGDGTGVREVAPELEEMGFSQSLASGEHVWPQTHPLEQFPNLRQQGYEEEGRNRVSIWQGLNEDPQPRSATAYLVAVLGSGLERESAAAAAALWRQTGTLEGVPREAIWEAWHHLLHRRWPLELAPWFPMLDGPPGLGMEGADPDEPGSYLPWDAQLWTRMFDESVPRTDPLTAPIVIHWLARWRLELALRSTDPVTRSLAMAVLPQEEGGSPPPPQRAAPSTSANVSTMIHGTWGWEGDWWRPGYDFHSFMLPHRPNLYKRSGTPFGWNGRYKTSARRTAGTEFQKWAAQEAQNGLQTLFGHSYGGEVASRAVLLGTPVRELVLLSTPANKCVRAAVSTPGVRVVDVRLRFDPVLFLARTRQRVPNQPHVAEVLFNRWCLDHGATHQPNMWVTENVMARSGL